MPILGAVPPSASEFPQLQVAQALMPDWKPAPFPVRVRYTLGSWWFVPPRIGLDGVWREQPVTPDWFAAPPGSFRAHFPYERSGDRARIGLEETGPSVWPSGPVPLGIDVEVRKRRGRWIAVECREVWASSQAWPGPHVVAPLRPWQ